MPFGFRDLVGFTLDQDDDGGVVVRLAVLDHHLNPNGVVHGGVTHALMDTAMGAAAMSVLDSTSICATIEMQIRYHRPVTGGELHATAEVVQAGRRVIHLAAKTHDAEGRLVASATSSYAVIDAP